MPMPAPESPAPNPNPKSLHHERSLIRESFAETGVSAEGDYGDEGIMGITKRMVVFDLSSEGSVDDKSKTHIP